MEKNKSYVYLLPMLNKHLPIMKFFKNLKNTYIFPKNEKEQIIYLTYKYPKTNLERFLKYEDTLFNSEYFEEVIEDEDYTTYIFKIPSEYSNDYNCFIEGKYSKINYKTQEEILEFWGEIYSGVLSSVKFLVNLDYVFKKHKKLKEKLENKIGQELDKDAELESVINVKKETYGN